MYPYFELGSLRIQNYYLFAALAGTVGGVLSFRNFRKTETVRNSLLLTLTTILSALVGARLLNVLLSGSLSVRAAAELSYRRLSLMGGLILGIVPAILYAKTKGKNALSLLDGMVFPAGIGIILLKTGCFLNGCCFGKQTDCALGVVFPANELLYEYSEQLGLADAGAHRVHPTQLYELAGTACVLLIIMLLKRKNPDLPAGVPFGMFTALFSAVRLTVLPFRQLPYTNTVENIIYPSLYLFLIIAGVSLTVRVLAKE